MSDKETTEQILARVRAEQPKAPEKPKTLSLVDQVSEIIFNGSNYHTLEQAKVVAEKVLDKIYG